jgi:hypothetical protein
MRLPIGFVLEGHNVLQKSDTAVGKPTWVNWADHMAVISVHLMALTQGWTMVLYPSVLPKHFIWWPNTEYDWPTNMHYLATA